MSELIDRQAAIDAIDRERKKKHLFNTAEDGLLEARGVINTLPSAQPETATVTIGRTRGGVAMWYECDACGESIDQKDCYCRNCGRKLTLPEPYRRGEK